MTLEEPVRDVSSLEIAQAWIRFNPAIDFFLEIVTFYCTGSLHLTRPECILKLTE